MHQRRAQELWVGEDLRQRRWGSDATRLARRPTDWMAQRAGSPPHLTTAWAGGQLRRECWRRDDSVQMSARL